MTDILPSIDATTTKHAGTLVTSRTNPPSPTESTSTDRFRWGLLLVTLTATFMTALDVFIVNVALPSMQRDLHAGAATVQWVVAGFGLAVGAGVITGGRLGDRFGRRRMFAVGMALFTVTSAACGLATSPGLLIAGRVAQGLAAALMSPQVLAILQTAYVGPNLARAFSAYGLTLGMGAVFGQLIGGLLIHSDVLGLGWRTCFLINVPIGVIALCLTPRMVPRSPGTRSARLDLVGVGLVTAALVATVLPLIDGQSQRWPAWTWCCFAAAGVLFGLFAIHQGRLSRDGRVPLIDMELFRQRTFSFAVVAQVTFWMGMASFFLVFALYVQEGEGLNPLQAGLLFTSVGAGYLATSLVAGRLVTQMGRQVVAVGTSAMLAGQVLLVLSVWNCGAGGDVAWLVPGLLVDGAGMGLALGPLTTITLSQVAPHHAGTAAGVVSTVMQVGGALGVAVIGVLYFGVRTAGASPSDAFGHSLIYLMVVAAITTALVQLVPDGRSPR
jgi:EmrB/QacA subfamily drug resistance transporter